MRSRGAVRGVAGTGARGNEIARPEYESCGLGLLAFGSHKAHGRALSGLTDRLGICGIVLLPLDERLDVRRRDQPDRMPEHAHLACPIMGAAAGLHRDRAGGWAAKNGRTWLRRSRLRNTTAPEASAPWTWKMLFARSKPMVLT